PEASVLDRDRCLRKPVRHLPERQRLSVRRRRDDAEQTHAVRVQERVLAEREGTKVFEGARREQDLAPRERDRRKHERDDRGEEQHQDEQDAAALTVPTAQPAMARDENALEL